MKYIRPISFLQQSPTNFNYENLKETSSKERGRQRVRLGDKRYIFAIYRYGYSMNICIHYSN